MNGIALWSSLSSNSLLTNRKTRFCYFTEYISFNSLLMASSGLSFEWNHITCMQGQLDVFHSYVAFFPVSVHMWVCHATRVGDRELRSAFLPFSPVGLEVRLAPQTFLSHCLPGSFISVLSDLSTRLIPGPRALLSPWCLSGTPFFHFSFPGI